jgi:tripeptidyl-peptidase-2
MKQGMILLSLILLTPLSFAASVTEKAAVYPLNGLMPKDEIGVTAFLEEYPDYDGRDVVIAVIDSGIDPGGPGLTRCPDGRPKLVDLIDASGAGDVMLSDPVQPEGGKLKGLTGRELKPGAWRNPSGTYRLGLKWAFDLLPGDLIKRLKEKRNETWSARIHRLRADRDRDMPGLKQRAENDREKLDDLAALDRVLTDMEENYEDLGPVYDCVVFHDGQNWCACIDTNENGDLGDETVMKDYRVSQQVAVLDPVSMMNYTVKIDDSGDWMSIVMPGGSHGTHVAGIAAAYHPDKPYLNGMAPGARLISIKIGDVRMGGSSNGLGEIRACAYVSRHHEEIDMINVSWGGSSIKQNGGNLLSRLYSDLVEKYNITACFSAGNAGPALSSAGSPGGETTALFGVAAYYSPTLVSAEYNLRQEIPENLHTFTSRGPCKNGYLGPEFAAPGAAVSSVPNYTLSRDQLMNGTSMAAPNACGGIALMISGLKDRKIPYTVERLRHALGNTARPLDDIHTLAQGRGLLQIHKAFQYLLEYRDHPALDVRYDLKTGANDYGAGPGYYRREPIKDGPYVITVDVSARFPRDYDNEKKISLSRNFLLKTDAPWIEAPPYLHLSGNSRPFEVKILPDRLAPGLNFTEITAVDSDDPGLGPVFRFPLTIIRPDMPSPAAGYRYRETLELTPAEAARRFIHVPPGAGTMVLSVRRSYASSGSNLYVAHLMQVLNDTGPFDSSDKTYFTLAGGEEKILKVPVRENRTIEVCLAQFWRSLDPSELDLEIAFQGIVADPSAIHMDGQAPYACLRITAPVARKQVAVGAGLSHRIDYLEADKSDVRPMSPRERFHDNRQLYQLVQHFPLELAKSRKLLVFTTAGDIEEAPLFQDMPAPFYMISDEGGRILHQGMPDDHGSWAVSLDKGRYTVRIFFEALDKKRLDLFKDLPLEVRLKLDKKITVPVFTDYTQLARGDAPVSRIDMQAHRDHPIYLGRLAADDLGEAFVMNGRYAGHIDMDHGDLARIPLTYHTGGGTSPGEATCAAPGSPEAYREAVTDMGLETLEKLAGKGDGEAFRAVMSDMLARRPDHLETLAAGALYTYQHEPLDDGKRADLIEKIDALIGRIDTGALSLYFTVNHREEDGKEKNEKEMARRCLHQLYAVKADLLFDLDRGPAGREAFEEAFRWKPSEADPVFLAVTRRLHEEKNFQGLLLEDAVDEVKKKPADRAAYERKIEILKKLGLDFWGEYEEKQLLRRIPPVETVY